MSCKRDKAVPRSQREAGKAIRIPPVMHFGTTLQRLIDERDWTYTEAAYALGIDHSYVSRMVRGERLPSHLVVTRMLEVFPVSDAEAVRLYAGAGIIPTALADRLVAMMPRERVVPLDALMTKLEQVGIGGKAA